MYVTRRRNRVLRKPNAPTLDPAKSNPSKRHRERLNGELEYLASLLPFDDSVIAKLDKLSILRLAVSYLRAKSYYGGFSMSQPSYQVTQLDVDAQLKALSGFIIVIDPNNEVFYVSQSVEQYLGFHQSDILHQCVLELVHSEDRDSMSSQLNSSNLLRHLGPNPTPADTDRLHAIGGESHKLLQRSLIVRFRCLLDNTSGFITMEISGHLRPLYGQIGLGGLALFAVCTPFGPALLADSEVEETTFRSKLSLNMNIINLDTRGELILGHKENTTLYNLLHPFDLQYFSDAHKEMIKAGSCGLVAYRLQNKDGGWLWLQTSARVVYRNNKPDYIMCFHRNLTEEEGSNLVGKRDLELAMPHFQVTSMSLADDGEYLEDMPSKHKARKTRRNHSSIDITDPVSCDKEQQIYYQFHGFPPAVQQYASPSASYFSDSNGVPVEMGYKPVAMPSTIDYLAYPNHLHMAVEADRLAAVARIHQPPAANPYAQSYYSLGASSHTVPPCAPLPNASRYCTQNYQSTNTLFGTDANANPLLSFRDMTYPLLNQ